MGNGELLHRTAAHRFALVAARSQRLRRPALWVVASMALVDMFIIGQSVGLDAWCRDEDTAVVSAPSRPAVAFGRTSPAVAPPREESIQQRLEVPMLSLRLVGTQALVRSWRRQLFAPLPSISMQAWRSTGTTRTRLRAGGQRHRPGGFGAVAGRRRGDRLARLAAAARSSRQRAPRLRRRRADGAGLHGHAQHGGLQPAHPGQRADVHGAAGGGMDGARRRHAAATLGHSTRHGDSESEEA